MELTDKEQIASNLEDLIQEADIEGSALNKWEKDFIQSVYGQFHERGRLSDKQIEIIDRIWDKMFGNQNNFNDYFDKQRGSYE